MKRTQTISTPHQLHIRVDGWISDDWTERFEGITQRHTDDGSTVLCGELKDQCELFGILRLIESRGMKILTCFVYHGGAA